MNISELIMFVLYILLMLGIGIYFFTKSKSTGEKDYFLGGRQMGAWVSGLSAGASDMSAWVLMGLPASVYAAGLGKTWIAIGLFIGYALSWILVAPRLRSFRLKDSEKGFIAAKVPSPFAKSRVILAAKKPALIGFCVAAHKGSEPGTLESTKQYGTEVLASLSKNKISSSIMFSLK